MLSLLAKAIAIFLHEYTYTVYGLFSIKTNEQRGRQQYMFAARGDIAQYRHREVRWEGLIMFSRQIITVFLCMNRKYISGLKSERLPLFGIH